jgi:gamma-glutamylcyclotransferase (GGCT)/AIG2-like uncharacterized protein YtfP
MTNLFTYGTLMYEPVWQKVVGKTFQTQNGVLWGFAAYKVRRDVYPAIIKAGDDDSVPGLIYFDIDKASLDTLDRFEGEFYDRKIVDVITDGSQPVSCHAYVIKPAHFDILDCDTWSAEWFEERGLKKFLESYMGFDKV